MRAFVRSRVARLGLMVVAGACEGGASPAPAVDAPIATKAAPAPSVDPTPAALPALPDAKAPAPTPTSPTPTSPNPPSAVFDGPLAATAVDDGALLVWARPAAEAGKSEIVALRLDARGLERGTPTLLRTTSGEVVAIAAHRLGDDAWIAWLARVAEEPRARNLVAAVRVAADLSAMTSPFTVDRFVGGEEQSADIRVLDLDDGGAAVGTPSGSATCTDAAEGGDTKCPGFAVFWVSKDGKVERAAHFGADGGDAEVGSLVSLGGGVVFDAWAWHGGPTHGAAFAPRGASTSKPPASLPECRPPYVRGFTGSEIVTLCADDYAEDGERCPLPGEEGTCARVHAVRLDGTLVTPKDAPRNGAPLVAETRRCDGGHPVLEVRWSGGQLVLDPQRAGASFDLDLGVWTGKHALSFPGGVRERWSCTSDGQLVLDERIAAELPFAHPTASLGRVNGKL